MLGRADRSFSVLLGQMSQFKSQSTTPRCRPPPTSPLAKARNAGKRSDSMRRKTYQGAGAHVLEEVEHVLKEVCDTDYKSMSALIVCRNLGWGICQH